MRTLLSVISNVLLMALLAGCASSRQLGDRTVGQSSVCDIHHVPMSVKHVAEAYGMKVGLNFPMDEARPGLFPHADEPYDTGYCMRAYKYWRVYTCPRCTEARTAWLAAHEPYASNQGK